jgi:hypothetical protein
MRRRRDTLAGLAAYILLTVALTWPLARGLTRDLPADLGDPLLNTWIMAHDAQQLAHALSGHPAALHGYWSAGIFFPHPFALAYSEHLTPQALEILPIYVLSHNPILCYNVVFLSTFILSALGMFLLVRELTGNPAAAFLAGLAFGFAPYRVPSLPHLQVLSSAWMPFTFYGFRRFFATKRLPPLAGGAAAWIAQNLSCGYYLLFFSPFVALYLAWELTTRRLWRDTRTIARLAAAFAVMAAATMLFLLPYLHLRRLGFSARSFEETRKFSADVYGYFTADVNLRLWGSIVRAWPAPEGSVFPGFVVVLLAAAAVAYAWRSSRRDLVAAAPKWTRALVWLLVLAGAAAVALLLGWSIRMPATRPIVKITSLDRVLAIACGIAAALLAASANARTMARRLLSSPAALFLGITLIAAAMSFGPVIRAHGRTVEEQTLYDVLFRDVPGFDGLRVPARFAMIVAFGLAALAGLGADALGRTRHASRIVWAACVLIVIEGCATPIPINVNDTRYRQTHLAPLPDSLALDTQPPAYAFAARLPPSTVLLELPLGEPAFDVRYMFYALGHGHPLVNGYSGGAPADYQTLTETFEDFPAYPDRAWQAITASGATHVVLHEAGYEPGRGQQIAQLISAHGGHEVAAFGTDHIFAIGQ